MGYYSEKTRSRSWVPFGILIFLVVGGVIFFVFGGDLGSSQNIRKPIQPSPGCVAMLESGNPSDKVDIVFLPDNYGDIFKFRLDSEELMNSFLDTLPYNSMKDMFNFYRIENLNMELNCNYKYNGDAIVCNPVSIKKEAVICPYEYPIVIVNSEGVQKFYELLRSSAWMGTASLNNADNPLVFAHEFAHAAFDFADEYVYGGSINWDAPNCDPQIQTCPKFSKVDGSECIKGCVNDQNARSVDVGIMRDFWKSDRYGVYNEDYIRKSLFKMAEPGVNQEVQGSMPLYSIEIAYSPKTGLKVVGIQESNGFPDGLNVKKSIYSPSIVALDIDGNELYVVQIPPSNIYLDGHSQSGEPRLEVAQPLEYNYLINIPRTEKVEEVVIKDNSEIIQRYTVNKVSVGGIGTINSKSINIGEIISI